MEYAKILTNQVFIMFLLLLIGFVLYKIRMISDDTNKQLTKLVMHVVTPALIINTYQMNYDAKETSNMLWGFALSTVSIVLAILVSKILMIKADKNSLATERFGIIFTNCGFMAIPIMNALFGSIGVFYTNTYITIYNIFVWSYGIMLMTGGAKNSEKQSLAKRLKPLVTPTMISIVAGLVMYFLQIKLPKPIASATEYVASMNTPLAMIVSGVYIAQSDIMSALKKFRIYYVSLVKCFVLPIAVMAVFHFLPFNETLLTSILIVAACPSGANTMLFASTYGGDVERGSNIFTLTTLMSIVSLPVVILLAQYFML